MWEVREAILEAAPMAVEGFSYAIPYYAYKGQLTWFAWYSHHIGVYFRPPLIEDQMEELRGYVTTKSAVHLMLDRPVPKRLL